MKSVNDIIIRKISDNDIINYSDVLIKLLKENYSINFPNKNNLSKFANKNLEDLKKFCFCNSAIVIGAFLSNELLGFLWAYKKKFLDEQRFHISHVIINVEYRRYGIGSKMIKKLEEIALKENIFKIELITSNDNINTINFYKKYGFGVSRLQFEKNIGKNNDN